MAGKSTIDMPQHHPGMSRYECIRERWEQGLEVLQPTSSQLQRGLALHYQSMVIDTFGFLPVVFNETLKQKWQELIDAGVSGNEYHFRSGICMRVASTYAAASEQEFLEALACAGVTGMIHTAAEGKSHEEDIKRIASSAHVAGWFGERLRQMRRPSDLRTAFEEGSVSIALSVNGPPCPGRLIELDDEISWLDAWYQLGVRLMHLSYNRRNVIATGCAERNDGGLSELGYDFLRQMNRVGIVVDVPHSSERTCLQAAETSTKPIMASHTGCAGIYKHIRNKSDRVLKAIADTNGLVGIMTIPAFLGPNASLNTLLDHITYATNLIGVEHVAIGTDTHYCPPLPPDYPTPNPTTFSSRWWGAWNRDAHYGAEQTALGSASLAWTNWPLFTVGLAMRGYHDAQIRKMLGLNLLRVLEENDPYTSR